MLGVCGKEEEADDLGSAGLKFTCRIPGVDVERRLRFLRQYKRKDAMAARGMKTPKAIPISRPTRECLVVAKVDGGAVPLLAVELIIVLWLPSDVTICMMTLMLGLLEPAVDRLLLEGTFVGVVLVEIV